ncbi:MAG: thioredoxin TrxA [Magnetococcales bacterium]|nr:thioredoxin TrxA [Magnetococcales bacterium]NGZ26336.1 thioredoxin TrxA [Magnetococcales bacterium]
MSENTIEVSDDTFEAKVLQATTPVLVDFWAEWCAPCRQVAPFLDQLAVEYKGKLVVAKINIDNNPSTPGRFGIRGIPTMIIFKNGKVGATKIGALPKTKLYDWVNENLA